MNRNPGETQPHMWVRFVRSENVWDQWFSQLIMLISKFGLNKTKSNRYYENMVFSMTTAVMVLHSFCRVPPPMIAKAVMLKLRMAAVQKQSMLEKETL